MRNLEFKEVQEVSGGPVPLIGWVAGIVLVDLGLIAATHGMVSGAEAQAAESGHGQCHMEEQ